MPDDRRLPIKVVGYDQSEFHKPKGGGSTTIFDEKEIPAARIKLTAQISRIEETFADVFQKEPNVPAVAKVRLKDKALAKSHRPTDMLNDQTCPIITVRNFGELLTTVTPQGLSALKSFIVHDQRQASIANISTIESIEPFTAEDAVPIGVARLEELLEEGLDTLKFKLFQHDDIAKDRALLQAFFTKIKALGLDLPEEIHYAAGLKIFSIKHADVDAAKGLMNFVGTQSLSPFPTYKVVRKACSIVRPALHADFATPEEDVTYPVLGIIDSGVDPADQVLAPWIKGRTSFITPGETDFSHGSFVAGLAVYSRQLNHDDERFPATPTKIVDVVALPKDDISVSEEDILQSISEALQNHPEVRVWNLSLGTNNACNDNAFSDFGIALDEMADEHDVQFVLAAGNYQTPPFRGWPAADLGQKDRICGPADSVRGLTVGALAHLASANSLVKVEEPSPFTRKGPGPMFIPKPEVTHYGGNCTSAGQFAQVGIMSFDGKGNIAENIGTSFSCPIVASIVTHVQVALKAPSKNLVKTLVIQSALLNSKRSVPTEFPYKGFGVPADVMEVLTCSSNQCTLVFEVDLKPGLEFRKENFPIPDCMRNADGSVVGEFLITLVYDPPLDAKAGSEYCRTNVEVSLGTYEKGKDGKMHHKKQIPIEAGDTKKREQTLVEHGFKWSPTKVYRRKIPKGIKGKVWRLSIEMLNRSGFEPPEDHTQKIALAITMIGPKPDSPVYDEVVRLMNRNGWSIENLQVEQRYRLEN